MSRLLFLLVSVVSVWSSCPNIRLNEIQIKATHNSYHVAMVPAFPDVSYTRANLTYQLSQQGIRGLELDFEYDAGSFPVSHNPLDPLTNCADLGVCWTMVKNWINSQLPNPPVVFIWIEAKNTLTSQQWDEFDTLAQQIFDRSGIFAPDDLRGSSATVQSQIFSNGWPTLAEVSGKVIFLLDQNYPAYITTNLVGRMAFPSYPSSSSTDTNAVFLKIDDSKVEPQNIKDFVNGGYFVRTFAETTVWPSETLPLSAASIDQIYFTIIAQGQPTLSYNNFIIWAHTIGLTDTDIAGLFQVCSNLTSYDVNTFACFVGVEQYEGVVMTADEYETQSDAADNRDIAIATGAQLIYTDYPSPGQLSSYYVTIGTPTDPIACNPVLTTGSSCTPASANDFTASQICSTGISSSGAGSSSGFGSSSVGSSSGFGSSSVSTGGASLSSSGASTGSQGSSDTDGSAAFNVNVWIVAVGIVGLFALF